MLTRDEYVALSGSIGEAGTLAEVPARFETMIGAYGLQNITYFASTLEKPDPIFLTTYDKAWVERYREEDLLRIDPVMRFSRGRMMPLDWRDLSGLDGRWQSLLKEAQHYNVGRQGISFPLPGVGGGLALFTVTANMSARDWDVQRCSFMRDVPHLAMRFHEKILQLTDLSPKSPFSPREFQCVQGLARGRAIKVIAGEFRISESTVRKSLTTAMDKLSCSTLEHLVALAVTCGFVAIE